MAPMTLEEIEAEIRDLRTIVNWQRQEDDVLDQPMAESDRVEVRERLAALSDELVVFSVLCTVKAAEGGCSRAGREIATLSVGELMARFVPDHVLGVAMGLYEGDVDGSEA